METSENIISTVFFYIIGLISLIAGAFCLFQKNTISAIVSALVAFWGIAGFYFLLNAPYLAGVQIIIWGVGIGIIMFFSVMTTGDKQEKEEFKFTPKILFTPVVCTIFAVLIIPFLIYQFGNEISAKSFSMAEFAETLYKNNAFGFEAVGVVLFLVLIGISAIIFQKGSRAKKGENLK